MGVREQGKEREGTVRIREVACVLESSGVPRGREEQRNGAGSAEQGAEAGGECVPLVFL